MVKTKIMHDCHKSSKIVQQLVFIILSKLKLIVEILGSHSPGLHSREICTDFHMSLLSRSETCLFLSKGRRPRSQKSTQMCLFWYLVATPNTLQIPSLYYHFSKMAPVLSSSLFALTGSFSFGSSETVLLSSQFSCMKLFVFYSTNVH